MIIKSANSDKYDTNYNDKYDDIDRVMMEIIKNKID